MPTPRPSTDKTSATPTPTTASPAHAPESAHVAHHINEFGELDANAVVHFAEPGESADTTRVPVYGARHDADTPDKPRRRAHAGSAMARLFRKPTLQQFFYNDVLFRHRHGRAVSREELFLDLVLVAGIATMGHHLRAAPLSWPLVESFLLLFFVVYAAWRHIVLLWNYWGVTEDMLDKIGVYFTFAFISGIALGAYDPFGNNVRAFVAVSSFLASFVPLLESFVWARADPLLKIPANRTNTLTVGCVLSSLALAPLLAAAFVPSERVAKNLFWVSVALQMLATVLPTYIVRYLHRSDSRYSRPAINIEHAAEKFEVLTMIFMGEAVIALLSEGAPLVAKEGSDAGKLYLAGFLCTAMLYSFQTLYVQVDNTILRRGKHALRHDARHGITWAALHMPYHLSLVLVATGLGLALRDVAFPPSAESASYATAHAAAHAVVRAASDVKLGATQFSTPARWLFSVGWASAMVCSALLSHAHKGGPRAATKLARTTTRCVVALGLMVGMPFTKLGALNFLAVFAAAAAVTAVAEFLLVQLDRVGLFRSELLAGGAKDVEAGVIGADPELGDEEDSDSVSECEVADENDERDMRQLERALSQITAGDGGDGELADEEVPDVVARALQRRMTRGHASHLVRKPKSKGWHQKRHALG